MLKETKEYRKVYDRGKCVEVFPLIINYFSTSNIPSIDKIMTKEKEDEEEEETANDGAE